MAERSLLNGNMALTRERSIERKHGSKKTTVILRGNIFPTRALTNERLHGSNKSVVN